jgi:putative ABC transport system substrate-binding protein
MSKSSKIVTVAVVVAVAGWFAYNSGIFKMSKPAQGQKKVGIIYVRQHKDAHAGFKKSMASLGYVEGKNVTYDEVLIDPVKDKTEESVRRFIANKVDVIWSSSEQQTAIMQKLMNKLGDKTPVVFMTRWHDPLKYGLIESYRSSGNNFTGVTCNMFEVVQKILFFFREINPDVKKVAMFTDGFMIPVVGDAFVQEVREQAPRLGMTVVEFKNKGVDFSGKAFHNIADNLKPGDIDALIHVPGHFYDPQEADEMALAVRLKIPHSAPSEDMPTGGQFSYSDDYAASAGQAAVMVDKIFKGTKPADIPIEFGAKRSLLLYTKRASDAGYTFPNSMLSIAHTKVDK